MKSKNYLSYLTWCAVLFVLICICLCNFSFLSYTVEAKSRELDGSIDKIIEEVDESVDFLPDRVIAVLDKKFSSPKGLTKNKIENILNKVNYKSIKDLSKVTLNDSLVDYYEENTFRQILQIDLKEKSKKMS